MAKKYWLFDKRDDSHLATTCRTKQPVNLIDFSDHLGPASGRNMILTEVDFGRIVDSTNVHYKLRVLMKERTNKRTEVVRPQGFGKDLAFSDLAG